VRQGKWKAVAAGKKWQLFDISTDVNETADIAKQYPEKLDAMKLQWKQWYESTAAAESETKKKK
jgi:arylsulfatase